MQPADLIDNLFSQQVTNSEQKKKSRRKKRMHEPVSSMCLYKLLQENQLLHQLDSNSSDGGIIDALYQWLWAQCPSITNSINLSSDCNRCTNEEDEQLALNGKVVVLGVTLGISRRETHDTLSSQKCLFCWLLSSMMANAFIPRRYPTNYV